VLLLKDRSFPGPLPQVVPRQTGTGFGRPAARPPRTSKAHFPAKPYGRQRPGHGQSHPVRDKSVPITMVTGKAKKESVRKAIQVGASD